MAMTYDQYVAQFNQDYDRDPTDQEWRQYQQSQGTNNPSETPSNINPYTGLPWGATNASDVVGDTPPPTATPPTGGGVPSYVNLNDPIHAAIWQAFQKKGLTPRDQTDFQYWVTHASGNGGWANEGNRNYWLSRFDQAKGGVGDYEERPENGGAPSGWFDQNAPSGVAPYTAPQRPNSGQLPMPTFTAPTLDDLLNDPGYLAQQDAVTRGLEHGAAGKGTLLSGGFLGKVLPRALAENAGSSFGNLYQRRLDTFNTQNAATFGTQGLNENAYQGDVTNALNQYKQRYQAYSDAIGNQFKLADLGLRSTEAGRP